jgi:hypothetical protein
MRNGRGGAYGTQAHPRFERIPASLLSSPKEFIEQLFTAYLEMCSHIGEDCRERADTERGMLGNREMMFAVLVGSKAKMAAGLASDGVAELTKRLRRSLPDRSRGSLIRQ